MSFPHGAPSGTSSGAPRNTVSTLPRPTGRALASLLVFALAASLAAPADGQAKAGIEAIIDRNDATLEDQLFLTVIVQGSQEAQPQLPDLDAFQVTSAGNSRQLQYVNGISSISVSYNFRLIPRQAGTFQIGAARVEIAGQSYSSKPFTIRIREAGAEPAAQRDIFVTARVSDSTPYIGQQVIYTWRLYRRVQILEPQIQSLEFPGFLVEDLGKVNEFKTNHQGRQFLVTEFKKAIFAQEVGTLTLPASQLAAKLLVQERRRQRRPFGSFLGNRQTKAKVFSTQPLEITVRPLPAAPATFSGLVGKFKIRAQLSRATLKVGESTTLKVIVSGSGNPQMIGQPTIPELSGFKIYDNQPTTSITRENSGVSGRKSYVKDLVPLIAGDLQVPALSLTYFDPAAGSYRTQSTAPLVLSVAAAEGQEELRLTESIAPTTGKVSVRILADDILPIYRGLDALRAQRPAQLISTWRDGGWLTGLGLPPLLFALFIAFDRRQRRFASDSGLKRRRGALRKAMARIEAVTATSSTSSDRDPQGDESAERACALAADTLRTYVGDKLGIEGTALTAQEIEDRLRRHRVDDELAQEAHRLLSQLEAVRYSSAQLNPAAFAEPIRQLIHQLDRQLTGRPSNARRPA